MNWKNEAIQRLRSYSGVVTAMENLSAEIRRVEAAMTATGSPRLDGPVSGSATREDWLLDNLMRLQLLKDRLRQTQDWKRATDRAMENLDPEEQSIIRQLYIEGRRDMELLSQNRYTTRSTLYRHRDKALEKFTLALYGPAC